MKRCVLACVVLAMAAPLYAVDVTFSADVTTAGECTILYSCDPAVTKGPVGIALDIDASAAIDDVTMEPSSFFDVFVDCAYDMGGAYTYGASTANSPVADKTAPGEVAPSTSFCVSVAGLGGESAPPVEPPCPTSPSTGIVAVLKCAAGCTGTIGLNAIRAGVVNKDGAMTTNLDSATIPFVIAPGGDCFPTGAEYAAQRAEFDAYVAAGADPSCWCAPPDGTGYQCDGDAAGDSFIPASLDWRVYSTDLNALIASWKATIATANPCADMDHKSFIPASLDWRVYSGDLNILIANWKKTSTQLPCDCPRPD